MNNEPTLSDLEDQEPTSQEDLEKELGFISSDLCNTRMMLRMVRAEEKTLMDRRNWLRLQLNMVREPVQVSAPAELPWDTRPVPDGHFNGTSQPECPDCTMDDI